MSKISEKVQDLNSVSNTARSLSHQIATLMEQISTELNVDEVSEGGLLHLSYKAVKRVKDLHREVNSLSESLENLFPYIWNHIQFRYENQGMFLAVSAHRQLFGSDLMEAKEDIERRAEKEGWTLKKNN